MKENFLCQNQNSVSYRTKQENLLFFFSGNDATCVCVIKVLVRSFYIWCLVLRDDNDDDDDADWVTVNVCVLFTAAFYHHHLRWLQWQHQCWMMVYVRVCYFLFGTSDTLARFLLFLIVLFLDDNDGTHTHARTHNEEDLPVSIAQVITSYTHA